MKNANNRIFPLKATLCLLLGVLFLASLLPLFGIARYALPLDDDLLTYQTGTARVWDETHSVGAVLQSAFETTIEYYNTWQGTYFSSFLMFLMPSVLPLSQYFLTPYIMLTVLIASTMFFCYALLIRRYRLGWMDWLLVSLTALLFQIQIMPSIREGIFWLSSACLYLLSYCFLLVLFGCLQIAHTAASGAVRTICTILAAILAFAVAGGAFLLLVPSTLVLAYLFIRDLVAKNRRNAVQTGVVLLILIAGTLLSVFAPGNAVRMSLEHDMYGSSGMSLFRAVLQSVFSGVFFAAEYTDLSLLLFAGICGLAFQKAAKRTDIRFYHPLIVLVATFALLCMQFLPTYYSVGSSGPFRQKNIIYFTLFWLEAINVINLEGWLMKKTWVRQAELRWKEMVAAEGSTFRNRACRILVLLVAVTTFCAFAQRDGALTANTSVKAFLEVRSGIAKNYYEQKQRNLQEGTTQEYTVHSEILP